MDEMIPFLSYDYGNPGSIHSYGRSAMEAVDNARQQVAGFFHCLPEQVIFTSGGTEGNNMVFQGLSDELRRLGKTHIVVSAVEHDSVLHAVERMCIKEGFDYSICPPDANGIVELSAVRKHIRYNTGLVSVMTVNNETGMANPVKDIGNFCKDLGIFFHTDCVQAAGIMDLDTTGDFNGADFITISGHKIGGPKGIGALFVRDRSVLKPLICGGNEQEFGLRGGTENVPGIVGLGKACELAQENLDANLTKLYKMMNVLYRELESYTKADGISMRINGDPKRVSVKTLNICFPGIDAETLILALDNEGVFISAGSACTAHESTPSHVLTAMGISDEDARSSVRISLSYTNTEGQMKEAACKIASCAAMLKGV